MTQITLWLVPLALGSVFGIYSSFKTGLRWSWGVLLQHTLVLIIALIGLFVIPKYDWVFAYLGWAVLLGFTLISRMLLLKMTQALGLLRSEQAISTAKLLRLILWGPPGLFWLDLSTMINFYLKSDTKSANEIYQRWHDFNLPKAISDSLAAYAMIGLLVMRDWDSTIEKYYDAKQRYENESKTKKKEQRFPSQVAVPAMRAFNETGRFIESRDAILLADLPSSNYGRESIETIFLSYFALLGSSQGVSEVLQSMKKNKSALPEHARKFWQARCHAAAHQYDQALTLFKESIDQTPEKDKAWRERTQFQVALVEELKLTKDSNSDSPESIRDRQLAAEAGMKIMEQCLAISEILNSKRPPIAVRVLTGLISIGFIITFSPRIMRDNNYLSISKFAFDYCLLDSKAVMSGEWWRLITYQFLHGGISHLFMNLFGLVWFGRFSENLFGTRNFLIIFFGSGILSGIAQVMMDPTGQAVGASGAILGIFGANLAATIRLKNVLPKSIRRHELSWMIALAVTQLAFDQLVNFLFPSAGQQHAVRIAAAAHCGGMISGFAIGWILPMRKLGRSENSDVK